MNTITRSSIVMLALGVTVLTLGCERPPPESIQRGYRGVAMEQNFNPRIAREAVGCQPGAGAHSCG